MRCKLNAQEHLPSRGTHQEQPLPSMLAQEASSLCRRAERQWSW